MHPKAVEWPKMKLKEPTVQVKTLAKLKANNRIITKVKRADMPDRAPIYEGTTGAIVPVDLTVYNEPAKAIMKKAGDTFGCGSGGSITGAIT